MNTALEQAFEDTAKIANPQARGFKFQELLRNIFVESRFEVVANPRGARPRQSDLFATRDGKEYLIEAKWQKGKITSADIDDLRARLGRVHPGVTGCLFSMSEFAQP